jgi:hypothetical protein
MKLFNSILKVSLFALVVFVCSIYPGCKDPFSYQPPEDTLNPAHRGPELLYPPNDTAIWRDQWQPPPYELEFRWTAVQEAEFYELHMDEDTLFNAEVIQVNDTVTTVVFNNSAKLYWRVRAYSTDWEWYSDWSPIWRFSVTFVH